MKERKKNNCIKIKNFYAFKDTMIHVNRGTKARYSRKRDLQHKGLISRVYKQLSGQKEKNPEEKSVKDFNRHYTKENIQMTN